MKNFLAVIAVGLILATTAMDADAARRLGGGSSLGRSTPSLVQKQAAPSQNLNSAKANTSQQSARNAAANPAGAAAKPASPWRGMLMGAAAALGIAGLLSALGLGGFTDIIMMMLMAVAAYYVLRLVLGMFLGKRMRATAAAAGATSRSAGQHTHFEEIRPQSGAQPVSDSNSQSCGGAANNATARPGSVMDMFNGTAQPEQSSLSIPAGFDVTGFEKVAKENFVKLQKAWDTGNVIDISDFTTNDLFVLITHQLRDRGNVKQTSEVIDITAKLIGIVEESAEHVAVVEFNGAMKISGDFEEVHERWILVRAKDESTGWLLAGIEQLQV